MRSPIGFGPLELYPEETLKRGGKAKKRKAKIIKDSSIKINIRNVQQRDVVHMMQGRVPPTPNIMPNSSRVFSAPSIHYAQPQPQYYGNAPSVSQPLSVMKDISTQRNVPKAEPEPDILIDVNPQGIRSGIDYTARAQPKSEERQIQDYAEDMVAKRGGSLGLKPFENDVYDRDAIERQHDAVGTTPAPRHTIFDSEEEEEAGQAGAKPLFAGLTRLPPRSRGPPSASRREEILSIAGPNRQAFEQNLGLLGSATKNDLQNLMSNYLGLPSKTGNTDVLREAIRATYGPATASSSSASSSAMRRGGMLRSFGMRK
jgi:hypothetical protein